MKNSQQDKQKRSIESNSLLHSQILEAAVFLLTTVAGLFLVTPSCAASAWSIPTTLTNPAMYWTASQVRTTVAQNAQGDAVAVWSNGSYPSTIIQASSQTAAGAWSAPVILSKPGKDGYSPDVAVSEDGTAMAIWNGAGLGTADIQVATLVPHSTAWSAPVTLSSTGSNFRPHIRFDGFGNAIAIWEHSESFTANSVQAASYKAGIGWSAPFNLSTATGFHFFADLAVNAAGDAVAVWNDASTSDNSSPISVRAVRKLAGGAWSKPRTLAKTISPGNFVGGQKAAIDGAGRVTVVWFSALNATSVAIYSAQTLATGIWSSPVLLSNSKLISSNPEVATDKAGNVTVIWDTYRYNPPTDYSIQTRMQKVGNTAWSAQRKLTPAGKDPQLAASPDGSLVVASWLSTASPNPQVSTYVPALGWSAPVTLTPVGSTSAIYKVSVSAGTTGTARAVWPAIAPGRHMSVINASTLAP